MDQDSLELKNNKEEIARLQAKLAQAKGESVSSDDTTEPESKDIVSELLKGTGLRGSESGPSPLDDTNYDEEPASSEEPASDEELLRAKHGDSEYVEPASDLERLKAQHGDTEPNAADIASTPTDAAPTAPTDATIQPSAAAQPSVDPRSLALIEAQRQANQNEAFQMMGKGAERIGAGFARQTPDKNYLNEMTATNNQPVENVLNQQKMAMLSQDQDIKARDLQLKKDMDDPTSTASNLARQILKRGLPDSTLKTENLSATQMNQLIPGLKVVLEGELNRENKKAIMSEKSQDNKDKQLKRDTDKQNSSFTEASVKAEGTRAPKDVQLALANSMFVKNAQALLNQYPNLNDMKQPQVNQLVSELSRMASGGVATGHSMQSMSSETFNSKLHDILNKFGTPTGAQLAPFIKNNASYITELGKVSDGVIGKYHQGIYNAYKDRWRPEQQMQYEANHPLMSLANSKDSGAPQGQVTVREKSSGLTRTLTTDQATKYLQDPKFELVK